jgi:hypothetical protein
MSSDATPVSSPEGLRFDQPGPGPGSPTCGRCQKAISSAYFEVNGHVVCASCKAALQRGAAGNGMTRLLRAAAFGMGGAVVGAGIYYAILAATGYEIGLVAIAVGWLVGRGVQKGSLGVGGWAYQTMAVGLTYLAIVSTYVPFIVKAMEDRSTADSTIVTPAAGGDSVTVRPAVATVTADSTPTEMTAGRFALGVLALVALAAAAPFLAGIENVLGLLIIGFALFQAWQMNRRVPLTITGPYAWASGRFIGRW